MTFLLLGLEAFITSFVLSWVIQKLFPKLGLMDRPEKYGHTRKAIPYPAGIVFYIVFVLHLIVLAPWDSKTIGFIIALTLLVIVSFIDDRQGISAVLRLIIQGIAALIIVVSGISIIAVSNPFEAGSLFLNHWQWQIQLGGYTQTISIVSAAITVIWIVLFVNTLNWLDEPGIVSGVSGISFLIIFILSLTLSLRTNVGINEILNADMIARLAVVGIGMCIAFLFFNFPPAKMLMGDSGSIPLGFIIGILSIYSGSKVATAFLVLGFPVLDAIFVVARRLYQGKSPFKGDFTHFHHRLPRIGFSEKATVLIIYAICFIFGMLALFLGTQGKIAVIAVMIVLSILIEYIVFKKEKQ